MATVTGGHLPFTTNGTTWVDLAPATPAATVRSVLFVRLWNADTDKIEPEIRTNVGPTTFDGVEAGRGLPVGTAWTPITRETVVDLKTGEKLQVRLRAAKTTNDATGIISYVDKVS